MIGGNKRDDDLQEQDADLEDKSDFGSKGGSSTSTSDDTQDYSSSDKEMDKEETK